MAEEAVKVQYVGDGKRIVYGKYMYPGDVREVSAKQAAALAKVTVKRKKVFKIVKAKKKAEAAPPAKTKEDEQPPLTTPADDPPDGDEDEGGEE